MRISSPIPRLFSLAHRGGDLVGQNEEQLLPTESGPGVIEAPALPWRLQLAKLLNSEDAGQQRKARELVQGTPSCFMRRRCCIWAAPAPSLPGSGLRQALAASKRQTPACSASLS